MIARVRQHARARLGNDLRGKSKMVYVRVRDDDAANVLERETARGEFGAQRVERRRVFRSRVNQRQFIAFDEIDIDRTDAKGSGNCDRV